LIFKKTKKFIKKEKAIIKTWSSNSKTPFGKTSEALYGRLNKDDKHLQGRGPGQSYKDDRIINKEYLKIIFYAKTERNRTEVVR